VDHALRPAGGAGGIDEGGDVAALRGLARLAAVDGLLGQRLEVAMAGGDGGGVLGAADEVVQGADLLGDQVASLALPLLAVEVSGASVAQAALLPFALFTPFLLFGLPVGAIVDRLPHRLTMLTCDVLQAAVFAVTDPHQG